MLEIAGHTWPCYRVDPSSLPETNAFPRLRRSGKISHFALTAAIDAVVSAGLTEDEKSQLPILFATSDGGVIYTRRFFTELDARGPGAGSPLLFPETVYNAAASHVAAYFQSDREATAMVGDAAVALSAISAGCELLSQGLSKHVLIIAANECDAISVAGYSRWKFLCQTPDDPTGNIFSEGAAAIVLGPPRQRKPALMWCREGRPHFSRKEAGDSLREILTHPSVPPPWIFASCQRTPLQEIEQEAIGHLDGKIFDVKKSLGEGLAFTAMAQIVAASHLVETSSQSALVTVLGFASGTAAASLSCR
ncbi:MAG: beta-ketoacyl synthase N-terminal-like domain-containing protein [Terrimicrobiaceae bacterium]